MITITKLCLLLTNLNHKNDKTIQENYDKILQVMNKRDDLHIVITKSPLATGENFKGKNINLRINFPQADGEDPAIINTDLISIFGFANLKIAFLGNFIQGQMFDSLMAYFNTIRIEVTNPHKIYFDIPSDEYSLNGYVAAKLKAKELCEDIVKTTSL